MDIIYSLPFGFKTGLKRRNRVTLPVLQVIVGSTRPGRVGLPVAEWMAAIAEDEGSFQVELVDLAAIDLPLMDEPNHPREREYVHRHTRDWSAVIERADAFVFVMPEYNYGFNAALKNALDYLNHEWRYKPVGLVSYGGVSAGTRAAQMIKQVVTTLRMYPVLEAVAIPFVRQFVDEQGQFQSNRALDEAAVKMLGELERVGLALRPLRTR
jgi:NAD(P)H-dependent FMN reductase